MDTQAIQKECEKDQRIMKILKVSELRHHIGQTNLGPIDLMIRYEEEEYHFLLDSTPLGKEENDKMLCLFFPVKKILFNGFDMLPDPSVIPNIDTLTFKPKTSKSKKK